MAVFVEGIVGVFFGVGDLCMMVLCLLVVGWVFMVCFFYEKPFCPTD